MSFKCRCCGKNKDVPEMIGGNLFCEDCAQAKKDTDAFLSCLTLNGERIFDKHAPAPADAEGVAGYTPWVLERHVLGKVYDLSQKNMNAMIADIERLSAAQARAEAVIDAASDLHTHPALYSEAMLRSPSLKARWEAFSEALAKYREESK